MTISPGTRLGPYEILAPIGAGGMGEVFRAKDTRLDRSVAIKVLPSHLSSNPQLRERFDREARAVSALNHPNICTLHDVGHEGGIDYIVMELLEGESLADRLVKGALPVEQVLRYGVQIAEGLDKAHRQGIVHRDLKPGNVMITKSGAKLLDFGLAKSVTGLSAMSGATNMATAQKPLTQEGTILGTFQYMAPEQLEGEEADARTDIFAFGALLYEMATGRRAFEGKTRTSLIAAIVSSEPTPISQIQPLTPPALEHVVQKCLAKDRDDRWQSAHDIAEELKWIAEAGSQAGVAAPLTTKRRRRERLGWLLNLVTAAVVAAATWGWFQTRGERPRLMTSSIIAPDKSQFYFDQGAPVLSPDGTRMAFLAVGDNRGMIWIRSLSGVTAQPLAGTEGASYPFWSSDSRRLAFFAGGDLYIIDAAGGPAQKIAEAPSGRGGAWSREGTILFAPRSTGPLMRVTMKGGAPTPVTTVDSGRQEVGHRFPAFLPDGQHFIYMIDRAGPDRDEDFLAVASLDGKTKKDLFPTRTNAIYSQGYLLYYRDRTLLAQRFDAKKLELEGDATAIAQNVNANAARADALISVSDRGDLAYHAGGLAPLSQLIWFNTEGKQIAAFPKNADYRVPALSHDGSRIAAGISDPVTGRSDAWVLDTVRNTSTRLTFEGEDEYWPRWSPDDTHILYTAGAAGVSAIVMKRSSGTGPLTNMVGGDQWIIASDINADASMILYQVNSRHGGWDLWLFSTADRKSRPFLQTPYNELLATFSPDGSWVSYTSNESGRNEVYVQPVSGTGGKWQISTEGGSGSRWRRDGKQLYFLTPDDTLMAVDIEAGGDQFAVSVPRALFKTRIRHFNGVQYDVSPDGSRFLVNVPVEGQNVAPITLVQNWTQMIGK